MIFNSIAVGILNVIGWLIAFWPQVVTLPFGADAFISYALNVVFAFAYVFWPMQPIMTCLILYMGFKAALLLAKLILGARMPAHV